RITHFDPRISKNDRGLLRELRDETAHLKEENARQVKEIEETWRSKGYSGCIPACSWMRPEVRSFQR
ncbi:MAG: hypothetical protein ACXQTJ_04285, partial [Candidatus Syntropharchaeales archaeon]